MREEIGRSTMGIALACLLGWLLTVHTVAMGLWTHY